MVNMKTAPLMEGVPLLSTMAILNRIMSRKCREDGISARLFEIETYLSYNCNQ